MQVLGQCLYRGLIGALAAVAIILGGQGVPVSAVATGQDTTINVVVHDNLPGTLTTDPLPNGGVTSTASVTITGTVHNISQVILYVDGVYVSTLPLDVGATSFSFATIVSPGAHTLRLVGIDPYHATQVETTLSVTYVPDLPSGQAPNGSPGQQAGSALGTAGKAANDLGQQANGQINQATNGGPIRIMLDGAGSLLQGLGFMPLRDGFNQAGTMSARFVMVSAGMSLMVLPYGAYGVMHRLRIAPSPELTANGKVIIRVVGMVLFLAPLIFFV